MSEASTLATALAFARRGHGVFPLWWPVTHDGVTTCACGRLCGRSAAKHPVARYAPRGIHSASTDLNVIKDWWWRVPEANLAVVTEKLIVIDRDDRHGGDESFAALEREHGELRTWRTLTGGAGEHVIYAAPDGVAIACVIAENEIRYGREPPLGRGVDVMARGGYIVAPPSRHICGRSYCWNVDFHPANVPLAPAPDWLIERLTRVRGGGTGHDPAQWAADKARKFDEYRDKKIAEIAGKLLRAVSLDPRFVATLVHDWNQCHCVPPLPEDEVQDIFNRICKLERQRLEADHA
jgi:hypothetical protein